MRTEANLLLYILIAPEKTKLQKKYSFEHDADVAETKGVFCRLRTWIA